LTLEQQFVEMGRIIFMFMFVRRRIRSIVLSGLLALGILFSSPDVASAADLDSAGSQWINLSRTQTFSALLADVSPSAEALDPEKEAEKAAKKAAKLEAKKAKEAAKLEAKKLKEAKEAEEDAAKLEAKKAKELAKAEAKKLKEAEEAEEDAAKLEAKKAKDAAKLEAKKAKEAEEAALEVKEGAEQTSSAA
jgi:outer membrane biosynthesis protein TonB